MAQRTEWVSYHPICFVCMFFWDVAVGLGLFYLVVVQNRSAWWVVLAILLWSGKCRYKKYTDGDDE